VEHRVIWDEPENFDPVLIVPVKSNVLVLFHLFSVKENERN